MAHVGYRVIPCESDVSDESRVRIHASRIYMNYSIISEAPVWSYFKPG